jgi:hypothetical protein
MIPWTASYPTETQLSGRTDRLSPTRSAQAFYRFAAIGWVDWTVTSALRPINIEQLRPENEEMPRVAWDMAGFHDVTLY